MLKPTDDDQRKRNIARLLSLIKENTRTDDFVPIRKGGELSDAFDEPTPRAKKGTPEGLTPPTTAPSHSCP